MKLVLPEMDSSSDIQVFSIFSDVQAGHVTPLGEKFEKLCEGPAVKLIFDMQGAQRIDSSGIGELIKARNDIIEKGGKVVLMGVHSRVERLINVSGLQEYFPIAVSLSDAIKLLTESNLNPPLNMTLRDSVVQNVGFE